MKNFTYYALLSGIIISSPILAADKAGQQLALDAAGVDVDGESIGAKKTADREVIAISGSEKNEITLQVDTKKSSHEPRHCFLNNARPLRYPAGTVEVIAEYKTLDSYKVIVHFKEFDEGRKYPGLSQHEQDEVVWRKACLSEEEGVAESYSRTNKKCHPKFQDACFGVREGYIQKGQIEYLRKVQSLSSNKEGRRTQRKIDTTRKQLRLERVEQEYRNALIKRYEEYTEYTPAHQTETCPTSESCN